MQNDTLLKFQKTVCPDVPIDDPKLTARLIEEITKLKQDLKINEIEG